MKKQPSSRMCFICGTSNVSGTLASFYSLNDGIVESRFTSKGIHQGYPGRLHGGIIAGVIDETIGRTIKVYEDEFWGVTVDFNIKYVLPVPIGSEVRVIAQLENNSKRYFEGTGVMYINENRVVAEAKGLYIKYRIKEIGDIDLQKEKWQVSTN